MVSSKPLVAARPIAAAMGSVLALTVGCGQPSGDGVTASGTVTVDGQPLSGAVITLQPIAPTTGPKATASIFDGAFEFPASAELHGGTYRVRFSMIPLEIRKPMFKDASVPSPPDDATIAPRFDGASELTWQLKPETENMQTFEVQFR